MKVEAQGISISMGGKKVLNCESICCLPGNMTALIGPSGCGKTTLLNCLGLLLPIDEGQILIDGNDVTNFNVASRRKFWRDHAAFILQDYGIMDEETVAFNVTMKSSVFGRIKGNQERLAQVLKQTGLQGREEELASHLSGGEKQRLALARAIYKDAKILFVDEPTASLDANNRKKVIDLFTEFASHGRTVIVPTHDQELIEACDVLHEVGKNNTVNQVSVNHSV